MELNRWKLIAGGAALAGMAAGGIGAATADDGIELNDRRGEIVLDAGDTNGADFATLDESPESADSPNESVDESADSPSDSNDDAEFVTPAPAPAPSPAPAPPAAGSADSPGSAASANSIASAGSPDVGGSGDS